MNVLDLRTAISINSHNTSTEIDATRMTDPDPSWEHIDAAGHLHRWSKSETLPTLESICDTWEADEEGVDYCVASHYECKKCGARVHPGVLPGQKRYIVGFGTRELMATLRRSDGVDTVHLVRMIQSGERCRILLPHDMPELYGYLRNVQIGDEEVEVKVRIV